MSTYEAWRATHQDAEAAAKAAFEQAQWLAKMVDGLQAALGAQVRFGMGELEKQGMQLVNAGALQMVVNALRRDADEGKPVRGEMADELLTAIAPRVQQAPTTTDAEAPQALDALRREIENVTRWLPADVDCGGVWAALDAIQATPTADMGNTISQQPTTTDAENPASGAQDTKILNFLVKNYIGLDFRRGEHPIEAMVIKMPEWSTYSGDFRKDVTEAMAAKAQQGGAA